MRVTWQAAAHSITTLRTALFTTALSASLLLPMLYNPGVVHADSVVQYGTAWLGGGGVDIMTGGDGSHNCVSVLGAPAQSQCGNVAGKVYSGDKWQCVDMVNRLYLAKGWTTTTWWGNGGGSNSISNDGNLPTGMTRQNNGSISYLNPGDVLSLNNDADDAGHAGIIDTIDTNGTIHIKSQNADLNSSATITSGSLSAGNASYSMVGWSGYHVRAIVHHPTTTTLHFQPFAADFNGDHLADIGLRDVNTGTWFIKHGPDFSDQVTYSWQAGTQFQPFAADFNGDGIADIGLKDQNTGTWFIKHGPTFADQLTYSWAVGTQFQPFAADFDGNGLADIGLRDKNTGTLFIKHGPSFADQLTYAWAAD